MLCETCETVELEVLYDEDELELDVDFQGEIIDSGKIEKVEINEDGELVFTFIDGTVQNLGVVVGKTVVVDYELDKNSYNPIANIGVANALEEVMYNIRKNSEKLERHDTEITEMNTEITEMKDVIEEFAPLCATKEELNAAIGAARDIGTIEGAAIYDYDFKEGVWYTFNLSGVMGITSSGKVAAIRYTAVNNISYLFVIDLFTSISIRVDLKNKAIRNITSEWVSENVADYEFNTESNRPVANRIVTEAINNINASLGDIDTALDELHTYAQGLITGGAAE